MAKMQTRAEFEAGLGKLEAQQLGVLDHYIIEIFSYRSKRVEHVEADLLKKADDADWKLLQASHDFLVARGFIDYKIERVFIQRADYRRENE
jgi:SOS response regulatory protein OraA/RecX